MKYETLKEFFVFATPVAVLIRELVNGIRDRRKEEPKVGLERFVKEVEAKVKSKNETDAFEKLYVEYKKLINECQEGKRKIFNESQQLDIMLAYHEFTRDEKKSLIDQNITSQEGMKEDEVKKKLHEIGERREACKGCNYCNSFSTEL